MKATQENTIIQLAKHGGLDDFVLFIKKFQDPRLSESFSVHLWQKVLTGDISAHEKRVLKKTLGITNKEIKRYASHESP